MSKKISTLRKCYHEDYGFELLLTDAQGKICAGTAHQTDCDCGNQSARRRIQAAEQTRYWGETVMNLCCDTGYAMWAVPILDNNHLTGTLLVQGVDLEAYNRPAARGIQEAADGLLRLAVEANLINRAEMELSRQRAQREQDRFHAIESAKEFSVSDDLRSIYLREEPGLLGAIKQGDIREARSILNRILTGVYGLAGDRIELLKSSVLEVVVMMSRAAVEAGADPATLLGNNYRSISELAAIDDEEDLSDWVRRMLDTLIESIRTNETYPNSLLLTRAVRHMQANLHQHLRRDEVAKIAGVSPSHFSKLVTERLGRSFSHLLIQMRVTRAKELLIQTERSLSDIAMDCGFFDQSHFTKVFRSSTSLSPGEYRKRKHSVENT